MPFIFYVYYEWNKLLLSFSPQSIIVTIPINIIQYDVEFINMVECFEIGKTQNIVKFTMNKYISKHIIVTLLVVRFLYDDVIDIYIYHIRVKLLLFFMPQY